MEGGEGKQGEIVGGRRVDGFDFLNGERRGRASPITNHTTQIEEKPTTSLHPFSNNHTRKRTAFFLTTIILLAPKHTKRGGTPHSSFPFFIIFPYQDDVERRHQHTVKHSRRKPAATSSEIKKPTETLEIVDLSRMSLECLPNPTINLASICKLDISNNSLQRIPESLTARLLNVVVLDVHSNKLTILPNSIGCLSKLKVLNVAGNYLSTLPHSIQNCRLLEELNANFNKLSSLPDTIGFALVNLKKLSFSSNKLMFLPQSISHITSLCMLDARLNCLRSLPDDLENLTNLEVLNVSQNFQYLRSLPYSLGMLLSLIELDISYNTITTLPDSMGCLKKLQKLSIEGNPLTSPPVEVLENGLHAVKEYLCEKMNAGHISPRKKKSWIGKMVKYGTFNSSSATSRTNTEERELFIASDYRAISGLASPRYMGMFSPKRLFSPKTYFSM